MYQPSPPSDAQLAKPLIVRSSYIRLLSLISLFLSCCCFCCCSAQTPGSPRQWFSAGTQQCSRPLAHTIECGIAGGLKTGQQYYIETSIFYSCTPAQLISTIMELEKGANRLCLSKKNRLVFFGELLDVLSTHLHGRNPAHPGSQILFLEVLIHGERLYLSKLVGLHRIRFIKQQWTASKLVGTISSYLAVYRLFLCCTLLLVFCCCCWKRHLSVADRICVALLHSHWNCWTPPSEYRGFTRLKVPSLLVEPGSLHPSNFQLWTEVQNTGLYKYQELWATINKWSTFWMKASHRSMVVWKRWGWRWQI